MPEGKLLLKEIIRETGGVLSDLSLLDAVITGISSLDLACASEVSFITKERYTEAAKDCAALAVFVEDGWEIAGKATIAVNDPYWAYAIVAQMFENYEPIFGTGIARSAQIDKTALIAQDVSIGPGTVVGAGVRIGKRTRIDARVVIERDVIIGDDCHIQSGAVIRYGVKIGSGVIVASGAVIGSEGFANAFDGERFERIPCFGSVTLEDGVEIGANTTIDRGNFTDTVIRRGARIDNLVMVAHNCVIGESCGVAAQVGFAGSTKVGKRVMIAGQAGFGGHISIGDDSFIGGQAGVTRDVEQKARVAGSPAMDLMRMRRINLVTEDLPEIKREVKNLRKEIEELKGKVL